MKIQKFKQLVQIGVAAGLAALAASAYAQFHDSSIGTNALRGVPTVPQKYLPAQPTPIVNTYTTQQITQNVTQQVTQVVQPNTYPSYSGTAGGGAGTWLATAVASCGGDTLISGGGQCWTGRDSFGRTQSSYPSGNTWVLVCGADENGSDGTIQGEAYAICSR